MSGVIPLGWPLTSFPMVGRLQCTYPVALRFQVLPCPRRGDHPTVTDQGNVSDAEPVLHPFDLIGAGGGITGVAGKHPDGKGALGALRAGAGDIVEEGSIPEVPVG